MSKPSRWPQGGPPKQQGVRSSPLAVDIALLLSSPAQALLPVLGLLEGWHEVDEESAQVTRLSGAMSNLVYRCDLCDTLQPVVVRVFGTPSGIVDRNRELEVCLSASNLQLTARQLLLFSNGRVEYFLRDFAAMSGPRMKLPTVSQNIAQTVAEFHFKMTRAAVECEPPEPSAMLWPQLRAWLRLASEWNKDLLCELRLENVAEEIDMWELRLGKNPLQWLAMCHNDLQQGNIMERIRGPRMGSAGDLEHRGMSLIDFEYSGFNHIAFDIANHWSEWMAEYDSDQPHALNRHKFPSQNEQVQFIHWYLWGLKKVQAEEEQKCPVARDGAAGILASGDQSAAELLGEAQHQNLSRGRRDTWGGLRGAHGSKVFTELCDLADAFRDGMVVRDLRDRAMEFVPLSDLLWGLWAIVQDKTSDVDFQFCKYARGRLLAYRRAVA